MSVDNHDADPESSAGSSGSEEEDGEVYEVEAIVDHKKQRDGRLQFYLKWKGFPDDENTWQDQSDLQCEEMIAKYLEERGLDSRGNKLKPASAASGTAARGRPSAKRPSPSNNGAGLEDDNGTKKRKPGGASGLGGSAVGGVEGARSSSAVGGRRRSSKSPSPRRSGSRARDSSTSATTGAGATGAAASGKAAAAAAAAAGLAAEEDEYVGLDETARDWTHLVKSVRTLERGEDNGLVVHLKLFNGKYAVYPNTVVRKKAPQALLDFYEDHLKFKEDDGSGAADAGAAA